MAETMEIAAGAVTLDPAGTDDLTALARLYAQMAAAHGHPMAEAAARDKLALMLGSPAIRAILFRHEGREIGFLVWADLGDHLFVRNFAIDAEHRRRGLGAALFARARDDVLADKPLRLETSADHATAFWTAQGFRVWSTGMRFDADTPERET